MTCTLRHWTTISRRRAVMGLAISLSASWVTALACIQGLTHREGVFLRTSKTGSTHRQLRAALRLSRVELVLALALYTSVGLLVAMDRPPIVLILIILVQATVYLCSPIAALWNMRAQRVPAHEYRARFEARRLRKSSRRRAPAFATFGFAGALLLAVLGGSATAVFAAPDKLTPVRAPTLGHVSGVSPGPPLTTGRPHRSSSPSAAPPSSAIRRDVSRSQRGPSSRPEGNTN
jgi:hypothetical protein